MIASTERMRPEGKDAAPRGPARPRETEGPTLESQPESSGPDFAAALAYEGVPARIGVFALRERLGAGGMGAVYSAYDERLGREVAIKVVRADRVARGDRRGERRLLAEAQALARLTHPNVVTVHEVGLLPGGGVFLVMELIRGETLRTWCRGRPWRDIVAVYAQAGRGLAAAHAAAIVHRDFKPDNVLIGNDGRVRVVDFGLAIPADDSLTSSPVALGSSPPVPASSPAEAETAPAVTHNGVAGTPGYMAPEQCLASHVDARSDQFSFCVALYEAIYGERPYDHGTFFAEPAVWHASRRPRPAHVHRRWLYEALARGLAPDPIERFPSMDALVAELDREHGRGLRLAGAAGAAAVAAGGVFLAAALLVRPGDPCPVPEGALAAQWNAAARARFLDVLARRGAPWAALAGERIAGALDAYARAWIGGRVAACRATHVEHIQSADRLDRRMECLERRRDELDGVAGLVRDQPISAALHVDELIRSLGNVAACGDATSEGPERPPAASAAAVAAARHHLAQARALRAAGDYPAAGRAVDQAIALDDGSYRPLHAEVQATRALLAFDDRRFDDGIALSDDAANTALETGHDELMADVHVAVATEAGAQYPERAYAWIRSGEAALRRLRHGRDPRWVALHHAQGRIETAGGHPEQAVTTLRAALDGVRSYGGALDLTAARIRQDLGNALYRIGRDGEALAEYKQATQQLAELVGRDHPRTGVAHRALGLHLAEAMSAFDEAEAELLESRRIADAIGPDSADAADAEIALAALEVYRGRYASGLPRAERALAICDRRGERRGNRRFEALMLIGSLRNALGDHAGAIPAYRDAIATREGEPNVRAKIGILHADIAEAALAGGDAALALSEAREAVPQVRDSDRPEVKAGLRLALKVEGLAALALGRFGDAVGPLDEVLALLAARPPSQDLADVRWGLARTLAGLRRERARGRQLAVAAREFYRGQGEDGAASAREIERWLRTH